MPPLAPRSSHTWPGIAEVFPAIVALLAIGCGTPVAIPVELPAPDVVPTDVGTSDRRIDSLDLVVDSGGDLHLVYRVIDPAFGGDLPEARVVHARGVHVHDVDPAAGKVEWSAGEVVEAAKEGPARIVVGDDGLHLLSGRRLTHVVHGGDGRWTALGEILDDGRLAAESNRSSLADFRPAVDFVALPDGLRVAALTRSGREGPLALELVHRRGAETVSRRRLADHPSASERQPAPRIVRDDDGTLHLAWAVAEEAAVESPAGEAPADARRQASRLLYSRSAVGGGAWTEPWSRPRRIDHALGDVGHTIHDVELFVRDGRPTVLFSSFGLFVTRSVDGATWSTPRAVGGTDSSVGDPASLQVAGGLLVWIDQRFRDTGRRWWKPLGGWPWSDGTGRLDNDVFLLSTSALDAVPRRQTPGSSFAALARLADCGDHAHLVWAGRRLVDAAGDDGRARSEIFHRQLRLGVRGD